MEKKILEFKMTFVSFLTHIQIKPFPCWVLMFEFSNRSSFQAKKYFMLDEISSCLFESDLFSISVAWHTKLELSFHITWKQFNWSTCFKLSQVGPPRWFPSYYERWKHFYHDLKKHIFNQNPSNHPGTISDQILIQIDLAPCCH